MRGDLYEKSVKNPQKFWADVASREIEWFKKWDKVFQWSYPYFKWFVGGKLNVTHNCLDRHVNASRGGNLAFIHIDENYKETSVTYAELLTAVNKLAHGLRSLGVGKGDRVVLYMPLMIEQAVAMLASARIGAIHSVIFAGFSDKAVRDRVVDLKAKVVITADWTLRRGEEKELAPTVRRATAGLSFVKHIIVLSRGKKKKLTGREVDYDKLVRNQEEELAPQIMDAEDPLFVLYTSGSTGKPKGVVHTTGGYSLYADYTCKKVFKLKPDDRFWCTADPGWITGHSYVVYGPLSAGATSILVEGAPDYPTKDHWWKIVEKYRIKIFYTSPTAIRMFRKFGEKYPNGRDLSSIKLLGSVGEPINPDVRDWFARYIGGGKSEVIDTWWQTETGGHMIINGKPFFGIIPDIVNKDGKKVKDGEKGLLVIRKPWPGAMRDCWNDSSRYEKYWNEIDGVYSAGDLAVRGKGGRIQILGRSDDVINSSGHRIGTAEVESALVSHRAVAEAAVIGKPDEIRGEIIKAFLVLRTRQTENSILPLSDSRGIRVKHHSQSSGFLVEEIKLHVRREIGAHAVPAELEFVDKLPKTRSGKIMRRLLRAKESGQDPGDLTTLED